MYSKNLFRNLKIITNKFTYDIDFKKNIILENTKKEFSSKIITQANKLIRKSICEFIKLIKGKKQI